MRGALAINHNAAPGEREYHCSYYHLRKCKDLRLHTAQKLMVTSRDRSLNSSAKLRPSRVSSQCSRSIDEPMSAGLLGSGSSPATTCRRDARYTIPRFSEAQKVGGLLREKGVFRRHTDSVLYAHVSIWGYKVCGVFCFVLRVLFSFWIQRLF